MAVGAKKKKKVIQSVYFTLNLDEFSQGCEKNQVGERKLQHRNSEV